MILSMIIMICSIILFIIMLLCADSDGDGVFVWIGSLSLTVAVLMFTCMIETKNPHPTALDVYRGKTTLEITYRDSIAIDTTVVYKVR